MSNLNPKHLASRLERLLNEREVTNRNIHRLTDAARAMDRISISMLSPVLVTESSNTIQKLRAMEIESRNNLNQDITACLQAIHQETNK